MTTKSLAWRVQRVQDERGVGRLACPAREETDRAPASAAGDSPRAGRTPEEVALELKKKGSFVASALAQGKEIYVG